MPSKAGRLWMALVLGISIASGPGASGQDAGTTGAGKGIWLPVLQKHSTQYAIAEGDGSVATIRPDPLMRWTQPVRGGEDGILCLWTLRGRPVAAMTMFTLKGDDGKRWIVHEHQSLSTERLTATWQGRAMWTTPAPGVRWRPVPKAQAPAETAPARLRQMQAILRRFTANTIDNKESTWPLRPLTKPLYRDETTGPGVIDGALFALAQGTDPEAFVLIEARPAADGEPAGWYYAVARLTDLRLRVRLDGAEVFSAPYTVGKPDEVYQTFIVISKPSDDPADFERP